MLNFLFFLEGGGFPWAVISIWVTDWASVAFGEKELIYPMLLKVSAQTLPALTMLAWLGIAYPLLTLYLWAALGQWIIMRPMTFERDTFCFGCLVSEYIVWHAFWATLVACSSCHSSLSFTYSTAQGKLKSLQQFIRERTQDYRRVSYNFSTGIRNSKAYKDQAYMQMKEEG